MLRKLFNFSWTGNQLILLCEISALHVLTDFVIFIFVFSPKA